jgi:hypothetical protein
LDRNINEVAKTKTACYMSGTDKTQTETNTNHHMSVASKCADRILCSSVTCRDETRDELPILVTDYHLRQNPDSVRCHDGLVVRNGYGNRQIYTVRIGSARILPDSEEEENPGSQINSASTILTYTLYSARQKHIASRQFHYSYVYQINRREIATLTNSY